MRYRNIFRIILATSRPNKFCYKVRLPKDLITNFLQIVKFILINRDKYHSILRQ